MIIYLISFFTHRYLTGPWIIKKQIGSLFIVCFFLLMVKATHTVNNEEQEKLNNKLLDAARSGELGEVKEVLKNGAQIETKGYLGRTALMHAALLNYPNIVKFLIESNAQIDATDDLGHTALMIACMPAENTSMDVIKYFIEKGANINAQRNDKSTAIMLATASNNLDIIKYLVENGANIFLKDKSETNVLEKAAQNHRLQYIINYLELATHYYTAKAEKKIPKLVQKLYADKKFNDLDDLFAIALTSGTESDRQAFYDLDKKYDDQIFQLELAEKRDLFMPVPYILSRKGTIDAQTMRYIFGQIPKSQNSNIHTSPDKTIDKMKKMYVDAKRYIFGQKNESLKIEKKPEKSMNNVSEDTINKMKDIYADAKKNGKKAFGRAMVQYALKLSALKTGLQKTKIGEEGNIRNEIMKY